MNYYIKALKKYATFSGRAQRKEFWMFFLFNALIGIFFAIVDSVIKISSGALIVLFYSLAVIIPCVAITVRRLHDTDRSGWWIFLEMIPFVGAVILLIFMAQDSQSCTNKYGPNPKKVKVG